MASMAKTTKKYTYTSSGSKTGGNTDVTIEYSADLSSLSRLEVRCCHMLVPVGKAVMENKNRSSLYGNLLEGTNNMAVSSSICP